MTEDAAAGFVVISRRLSLLAVRMSIRLSSVTYVLRLNGTS